MRSSDPTRQPLLIILADRRDATAAATAIMLRRRGRVQVHLIDEASLLRAKIAHHPSSGPLGELDQPHGVGALPEDVVELGPHLRVEADTGGVWCRLAAVRAPRLPPRDQDYGDAEMFAFALSWLAGLGERVVNRPDPLSLAGKQVDVLQLQRLAQQVGLSTPELTLRSCESARAPATARSPVLRRVAWDGLAVPATALVPESGLGPPLPEPSCYAEPVIDLQRVLITGDQAVGVPPSLGRKLVGLASAAGLDLCEMTIGHRTGQQDWLVVAVSPVPTRLDLAQLTACAAYLEE